MAPLEAKVAANPLDHQARFDLALALNARGNRRAALDHLIEIVKRDRKWNDDGARKQLLQFFEAWGANDEATDRGAPPPFLVVVRLRRSDGPKPMNLDRETQELPRKIPVFPLAGALLLPRAQLPLNIFEPRYLAMVDDALEKPRIIGIIQPDETKVGLPANPALYPTGCAGRITQFAETGDGRYLITLTGIARFKIEEELSSPRPIASAASISYRMRATFSRTTAPTRSTARLC